MGGCGAALVGGSGRSVSRAAISVGAYDSGMRERFARNFGSPDETIEAEGVVSDHVDLRGVTVARDRHQPGWRWSVHVRPLVGGDWCETRHLGYVLRGRLRVVMREGVEFDLREGDVFDLPSGHDHGSWETMCSSLSRGWGLERG